MLSFTQAKDLILSDLFWEKDQEQGKKASKIGIYLFPDPVNESKSQLKKYHKKKPFTNSTSNFPSRFDMIQYSKSPTLQNQKTKYNQMGQQKLSYT